MCLFFVISLSISLFLFIHAANAADTNNESPPEGWTQSPNGRGTMDITWACITTVSLCSWSSLCLNLPAPNEQGWRQVRRKMYFTALGVLGPEFLLMLSLGQWESARRSVKEAKSLGITGWTVRHGFFADMGGFILEPPDWNSFPIDAKQFLYLVKERYVTFPELPKDIDADAEFVRVITWFQILWFSISCIARAFQHLSITTLELTTLGFVVCSFPTSFLWAHKPSDSMKPIGISCETPLQEILKRADIRSDKPYRQTPLDFVYQKEWNWTLYWHWWFSIPRRIHLIEADTIRPIPRVPNDNFPEIRNRGMICLFFFNAAFAALNLGAWNFYFPTATEQLLWRISTTAIPGTLVVFWIWNFLVWEVAPRVQKRFPKRKHTEEKELPHWYGMERMERWRKRARKLRNLTVDQDPNLDVPRRAVLPLTLVAIVYVLARGYIVIEDFAALRAQPADIYDTVDWSQVLPHVW